MLTLVAAIFLAAVLNRTFLSNRTTKTVMVLAEPTSVEEYVKRHYPTAL